MLAYTYIPQPPLADCIELMWIYEGYAVPHSYESLLPTGTTTLVINFALREATLCGAHSVPFQLETARMVAHIGVHFRPGGAFPFLNLPVNELQNQVIALDTLWGNTVYSLRDRLLAAATAQDRFRLLEQSLLARLVNSPIKHPAVSFALHEIQRAKTPHPVTAISEQIGLSTRRFSQLFGETVGLPPKLFCGVQRFQRAIQCIEQQTTVNWVDLALTCGYFDQAHFIHDFHRFAALTPTSYLAQRSDHRNHVPVQE